MGVHIGTSGWSYDHWQGILYPHGIAPRNRLDYYVRQYQTVELNSSFYHWPANATFKSWKQRLPTGFLLTVKAPRHLTHSKKLYAPEKWIERIKMDWHDLDDKRAILLVQLSPNFAIDLERLQYFLKLCPKWIKLSVEFRHPTWHQDTTFQLLEQFGAAYCIMSGANLPCILRATAPFVYVRMHGPDQQYLYGGSYSDADLHWWAHRIKEWEEQGKDVFVYFNNDGGGNAVYNSNTLIKILG